MSNGNELAKKAFEKAIDNVRQNCQKLEKFVGQDNIISTKKDFLEFAEKVGDTNVARSFCLLKYGKPILEVIDDK